MNAAQVKKTFLESFYRLATSGVVPRRLFAVDLPAPRRPAAEADPARPLRLEIVSHCWRYAPVLTYQLSSLVLHPPREVEVQMTVFHSPEDAETVKLLEWIGGMAVPRVTWNWQPIAKTMLFRRGIGRNLAARATRADWIWFADCDVVFHEGALDSTGRVLRGRDDYLVFPRSHGVTPMLEHDDPVFLEAATRNREGDLRLLDIRTDQFEREIRAKAVGAFQIVRGDVARAAGYCGSIRFYQEPVGRWQKTYEDRTFRWLLGTQGTSLNIPGIYRIRHVVKGRKTG